MILQFVQDGLFAAIAAIGFASISNPPRQAYLICAVIAAIGHSARYLLIHLDFLQLHIVLATTIASLLIGVLAVVVSPRTRVPAETYLYPSLLPMIPGIYAYRAFGGLAMCLYRGTTEADFSHYFYLFTSNGLTCFFILLGMAIGATVPMFAMKKISFQATRPDAHKL